MESEHLTLLQKYVEDGEISVQTAVERVAIFIQRNFTFFTDDLHDDDFKSTIVLEFLQRGHRVFEKYNSEYGSFFTYLYSFVKGLILTESKRRAIRKLHDKVNVIHSLENFFEMDERNDFTLVLEDSMNVPYAYKPITKIELERTLKEFMAKRHYKTKGKSIIILALKASYDITETEINLICNEFNLNKDDFYNAVQYLKETLTMKLNKKDEILVSRNRAYYNHMKYSEPFAGKLISTEYIKQEYETKFNTSTRRWQFINNRLLRGLYQLSPSNDEIAKVLGISTRQVCYYIRSYKSELEEIKKNKIETFGDSYYDESL